MSFDYIVTIFCQCRNTTADEITGQSRNARVCDTRYMIWYYLHYNCGVSVTKLSARFKRNRPSIFRGIRILKQQLQLYKPLRQEYANIIKQIEAAINDDAASKDDM